MKRRTFLLLAASAAACGPQGQPCAWPKSALASLLPDDVAAIGRAYVRTHPTEILDGFAAMLEAELGDPTPEQIAQRIHQDFVDGDVVRVDGWRLSRTEARLAALVYYETCS